MKNNILRRFGHYCSSVLILSGIYIGCFIIVNSFVYGNYNIPITYISNIFLVSLIVALLLELILKLNKLHVVLQITLIYIVIMSSIYLLGYINSLFVFNKAFLITSIIINCLGFLFLIGISLFLRFIENKNLNESLKHYKERD